MDVCVCNNAMVMSMARCECAMFQFRVNNAQLRTQNGECSVVNNNSNSNKINNDNALVDGKDKN